jgi:hypothetical protein
VLAAHATVLEINQSIAAMWFITKVKQVSLARGALLYRYQQSGDYTDCFCCSLPQAVTQAQLVAAFYQTWLFKLERHILAVALKQASDDAEAVALSRQQTTRFSAWRVEEQNTEQLLMADIEGRTRHWLMADHHDAGTRLYFGSAVIKGGPNRSTLARFVFSLLGGFHILYSRLLLAAAAKKLGRA